MNQFPFSALLVAAAVGGSLHNATGQMINPTVQTSSTRVVASRSAPATAAKLVPNARVGPQVAPRPTGLNPQRFNSNLPRTVAQPPANLQRAYAPIARTNPNFASLPDQRSGPVQRSVTIDPATRQTEVRTLAAMRQRRGVVTREGNILDPATRQGEIHTVSATPEHHSPVIGQANRLDSATRDTESRTLQKMRQNRGLGSDNRTLATINPQPHMRDAEGGPQRENPEAPKDGHARVWRRSHCWRT